PGNAGSAWQVFDDRLLRSVLSNRDHAGRHPEWHIAVGRLDDAVTAGANKTDVQTTIRTDDQLARIIQSLSDDLCSRRKRRKLCRRRASWFGCFGSRLIGGCGSRFLGWLLTGNLRDFLRRLLARQIRFFNGWLGSLFGGVLRANRQRQRHQQDHEYYPALGDVHMLRSLRLFKRHIRQSHKMRNCYSHYMQVHIEK